MEDTPNLTPVVSDSGHSETRFARPPESRHRERRGQKRFGQTGKDERRRGRPVLFLLDLTGE